MSVNRLLSIALAICLSGLNLSAAAPGRQLSFDERLEAQRTIDRIYYEHQVGATKAFEEAVPWEVTERKVRTYLKQSVALERIWKRKVTLDDLMAEQRRMIENTRMPDRLAELHSALGDDPLTVLECLVRPALVDRLSRDAFSHDRSIHGAALRKASILQKQLADGRLDLGRAHPLRSSVQVQREGASSQRYERLRALAPDAPGQVSALRKDRDAYRIHAVLDEQDDRFQLVTYTVPRKTWDAWWGSVKGRLDERLAKTPHQDPPRELATPGTSHTAATCQPEGWSNGNLATPGFMAPRAAHQAMWTGSHMIVWNGDTPGFDLTGDKYDPATDSAVPLSNGGGPPADFQGLVYLEHAVVWTGQEMLFWGTYGVEPVILVGAGRRYDPMSDMWREISRDGAPVGRRGLNAVWTGNRMMLVGGRGYVQFGSETVSSSQIPGGSYDPVSNTWGPGPGFNRVGAVALLAGDTIIVWGGNCVWGGSLSVPNPCDPPPPRGLMVDPSSLASTPMSTVSAPAPEDSGSAVWTGSDMILWGGVHPVLSNRGARFNPAANQWTQLSTLNAPSARRFHTGVWTGEEMVVWGGWTGSVPLGTGGRYDPATDTWTPVTTLDAPSPRFRHTAVWSGQEMILWGGYDLLSGPLGTGGRYAPSTNEDADGDGIGECTGDCDDSRGDVYPGAPQICGDGLNNDCLHPSWPAVHDESDDDGDAYTECNDCDDANPAVYPGAPQICDGLNNDCLDSSYPQAPSEEQDDDDDGVSECAGDCDDTRRTVSPGASQVCGDGLNNNCLHPSYPGLAGTNESDDDRDGVTECGGDCNDAMAEMHRGAPDLPGNALDEDCDGVRTCDPAAGWRNQGQLQKCIVHACMVLVKSGLVSHEVCMEMVRRAAKPH